MSSSPFDAVASTLTALADSIGSLAAPRLHPQEGTTAERADALAQSLSHTAVQVEDWLAGLVSTSQAQAELDHTLSSCMTPAALAEWKTRIARCGDRDQQLAEIDPYLAEEEKRSAALKEHAAGTFSTLPEAPGSCTAVGMATGEEGATGGETEQGDPQGLGGALEEEGTAPESGSPDNETPATMSTGTPETPVTMSTGAPRETATAANTELSSSTMTSDPAARAALSGQTAQGTPQVSGGAGQPAAMGGVPASQQLSQPARGGSGGAGTSRTAPRSPEARREAADKEAERDATVQAAAGVTMAGAGGAMGAAMTSAPSPSTTTSGAPAAPAPATPSAAPANPATGAGGAGMGGAMGRGVPGAATTLGSGATVKPVLAADQPLTPAELDRLLTGDGDDKKDGTK